MTPGWDGQGDADGGSAERHLHEELHDLASGVRLSERHVVEQEEEDDGRAVVEHGLTRYQGRELLRRAHLLEERDDGDWVGGSKDGAHEHGVRPAPVVIEHEARQERAQERAERDARAGKEQNLQERLAEGVEVHMYGVAEQQRRQEDEQQEVRVDFDPHADRRADGADPWSVTSWRSPRHTPRMSSATVSATGMRLLISAHSAPRASERNRNVST